MFQVEPKVRAGKVRADQVFPETNDALETGGGGIDDGSYNGGMHTCGRSLERAARNL
jgi:hypothetical protein